MKNITNNIILILFSFVLFACGEDRTYEYLELTKENQWIYNQMKECYYWKSNIKEPERSAFFQNESKFFESLINSADKASYFEDTISVPTYGMSFAVMRDPLGIKASNYYALIVDVQPGSPAAEAGIVRGTWITKVGRNSLSANNYSILQRGDSVALCTSYIDYNDSIGNNEWHVGDTLQMRAAIEIEPTIIALDSIYEERGKRIGYIVCDKFMGSSFAQDIQNRLSRMQDCDNLIIDLRYNVGSSIECACTFANLLLPADKSGNKFCTLVDNDGEYIDEDKFLIEGKELLPNLENIYLLIGGSTGGAVEAFIAAMKKYSDKVVIVGENSAGVNYYTKAIESPFGFTINPVIAQIYTDNETMLPAEGITPDYFVNEFEQIEKVYQRGERQEYMLYCTMHLITSGGLPRTALQ